jgi:hypothetical protein
MCWCEIVYLVLSGRPVYDPQHCEFPFLFIYLYFKHRWARKANYNYYLLTLLFVMPTYYRYLYYFKLFNRIVANDV